MTSKAVDQVLKQPEFAWVKELPMSITVCDTTGIILEMNDRAMSTFAKDGPLLGKNVLDCHPEPARSKLQEMLRTHEKNVYTIEKAGKKKLIYQTPWFVRGEFAGIVELSMEIPMEPLPHFVRKP